MRENMGLYRGKCTDGGEWVFGWYCKYPFGRWPLKSAIIPLEDAEDGYHHFAEVDYSTVGEFTGLTDKNGTQIFEGDVVLFPWNDGKLHSFTIVYEFGEFLAKPEKETREMWAIRISGYAKKFEIIGNIYEED